MADGTQEWLRQADYDLETAEYMLKGGRRFYAVFMAHLAVEKALKGLYQKRLNEFPPKTHDLVRLAKHAGVVLDSERYDFFTELTNAQVVTRYADDMARLQKEFDEAVTMRIIEASREAIVWVKTML